MKSSLGLAFFLSTIAATAHGKEHLAKNVVLFLGDACGLPTLNAASLYGYGEPRKLFVQHMPNIGLSETSAGSEWVTDSAAGMTAIVTGIKTNNGVLSQSASAVRGKNDGAPLKTILEYAEEHGLSTGVVSNSPMDDATPAALYAHVNDRGKRQDIFVQILSPRFGDGVDVVIGPGRKEIFAEAAKRGVDLPAALRKRGYAVSDAMDAVPADARRAVVLSDRSDDDMAAATEKAIAILSRNPRGYFLMVESDLHANVLPRALSRAVAFDRTIRRTAERGGDDTLVLFTADHSFDFRLVSGRRGAPLDSSMRFGQEHSGEEVLVAAQGPGAERVHGVLANTDLFGIMLAAYGWQPRR